MEANSFQEEPGDACGYVQRRGSLANGLVNFNRMIITSLGLEVAAGAGEAPNLAGGEEALV